MTHEGISLSRQFEELVAEYYRAFGATVARVDVELGGRQIDVYVEEFTGAGARVRTAIECKKYTGVVGAEIVTAFSGVVLLLKHAQLIDKAAIVAEQGFSKPARQSAAAADIDLFTLADLKARRANADAIELLTIAREDLVVSFKRDGRIFQSAYSSRYSLYDQNLVQRVKLLAEYLNELERLTLSPSGTLVIVDATGAATEFANWLTNPLYGAILQASSAYANAYRKVYGEKSIAVQRNFVLDPAEITPRALDNLRQTLRLHARFGLVAGIILKGRSTPDEVVGDIADLAQRVAMDFGLVEGFHGTTPSLREVVAPSGDPQFNRIRDRVAWTTDRRNLDAIITRDEDIAEVIDGLSKLLRPTD